MCFNVPIYMLASGLMSMGLSFWETISNVLIGNIIIMFIIILNSNVGIKYGIPYPVFARLCFGMRGAMVAALARRIVGAGWFGINCWIGGQALSCIPIYFFPNLKNNIIVDFVCFFLTLVLCTYLCYSGINLIKKAKAIAAPILAVFFISLFVLFLIKLREKGYSFFSSFYFKSDILIGTKFWSIYLAGLIANIAFWSTLSLNIPDLSRFVRSQKEHNVSILFSLPGTMMICSFVGIFVTGATKILYGAYIWDPVSVLSITKNGWVIILGSVAILISTVVLNVAANMLATANDISSIWPKHISYKMAVTFTAISGIIIMPWKLLSSANAYIFDWLGLYGVLLAPLAGIFIADYYIIKKRRINLIELYSEKTNNRYWYSSGFNKKAFVVWIVAIIPALMGRLFESLSFLYLFGWIIGVLTALFFYVILMSKLTHLKISDEEWEKLIVIRT